MIFSNILNKCVLLVMLNNLQDAQENLKDHNFKCIIVKINAYLIILSKIQKTRLTQN